MTTDNNEALPSPANTPFDLGRFDDMIQRRPPMDRDTVQMDAAADEIRRLRTLVIDGANAKKSRLAIAVTIIVGVISAGAMASSCAGQAISYRQMKAIETIATECHR